MKKTIYALMIVSFVAGLAAITAVKAQDQGQSQDQEHNANLIMQYEKDGLEKIHSLDELKDYQSIKKVDGDLFGVRRATSTERVDLQSSEHAAGSSEATSSKLEKIDHPALINLFEKIRQIGTALWGVKKPEAKETSSSFIAPEISACVATAISIKDTALMARVTAAATELNAAITARSACQRAAVVASSTPRATLNACVKTFNVAQKTIKETSKTVQQESWSIYKDSLKACASSTSAVPMVEDGGNIFE